jgi:hypothetical protein
MKTARTGSFASFITPLLVVAVKFNLITRLTFMGRRKKVNYVIRALFLQTRTRR